MGYGPYCIHNLNENNSWCELENTLSLAIRDLTLENLYHLTSDVEISQNGCFGVFTQKICLKGGKTKEQINLDKYMMQNKKIRFNFNKFYIHKNGKPYELWGYTDKRRKSPFVVINTNNIYDNVLLSEDKVMRFFT